MGWTDCKQDGGLSCYKMDQINPLQSRFGLTAMYNC